MHVNTWVTAIALLGFSIFVTACAKPYQPPGQGLWLTVPKS